MFSGSGSERGVMQLTYTYLGSRERNSRQEAVVSIQGTVRGLRGREMGIGGRADGLGLLDLTSGQIALARVAVSIDLDMRFGQHSAKANGVLNVTLSRGVVKAKGP
jgi:hypothetical protein